MSPDRARRGFAQGAPANRATASKAALRRHPRTRGVSLIELLVALGLAAALIAAVAGFIRNLSLARDRIESRANRDRAVDAFLDALERAVATSVAEGEGSGLEGHATSCTIHSAAVDVAAAIDPIVMPFPETVQTWFGVDEEAAALLLRRGRGDAESLAVGVSSMRLRYHDGVEWVEDFDSGERGRLPVAIEVTITFAPKVGGSESTEGASDSAGMSRSDLRDDQAASAFGRRRVLSIPDAAPAELLPASRRISS